MSIGVSGVIYLIGHILMMQMDSLNSVLIRVLELISVPNHSRDSFILKDSTFVLVESEIDSVHWS